MNPILSMQRLSRLLLGLVACSSTYAASEVSREQLHAVLWMQLAIEYRANAVQTYKAASAALRPLRSAKSSALAEPVPKQRSAPAQPAVVMDIDETVLDNSPYLAALVRDRREFEPLGWQRWVVAGSAEAVPGVTGFVTRARELGYAVVFISNRNCDFAAGYDAQGAANSCPQKQATIDNIAAALGYRPSEQDVLLRGERNDRNDADKRARRQLVAQRYRIAMLIGDDLNDFVLRTDYQPTLHGGHWGNDWFIVANAIYGSWSNDLTIDQKYSVLRVWVQQQEGLKKAAGQ